MCDEKRVIGYWMSEKKQQKMNWAEFRSICDSEGFILKPIDISSHLESQGPLDVFVHKLTDILAHATSGDENAKRIVSRLEEYTKKHSELVVIDPLENVRNLNNRYRSYETIRDGLQLNGAFVPKFVELRGKDIGENRALLRKNRVKYPIVCKPLFAHGSSDAHKMMVMFNEEDLARDCQPPCVAQEFISHNAILYKVFIVGEHFHAVQRPSLRNFYEEDGKSMRTIFFRSHDISRSGSTSKWSVLSEKDIPSRTKPNEETLEKIGREVSKILGLTLVGVDVVIENHSGKYGVIDANAFPGYDGYPNFFAHLLGNIKSLSRERQESSERALKKCPSDDMDSGFESDEKKKRSKERRDESHGSTESGRKAIDKEGDRSSG